jgi:hypothetical protein
MLHSYIMKKEKIVRQWYAKFIWDTYYNKTFYAKWSVVEITLKDKKELENNILYKKSKILLFSN